MNSIEILDNLFFIQRGYLNANHFVYRSSPVVLIDTGYHDDVDETRRAIEALGVDIVDIDLIVNTHCHCDHVGGNRAIQADSGCGIALHPVGRHFIETRDSWSTWWRYFDQQADFFDCSRSLADGETLYIGDHRFEVIHTAGHASDGIVLYHKEQRLLISSDTLWENDLAVMNPRVEGNDAIFRALASLDRIAALDIGHVFPGHGAAFQDADGAIERTRERLHGYLADRRRIGNDLLKKIIVYTLLMHKRIPVDTFFDRLMAGRWFRETVALYFPGEYRNRYDEIMEAFSHRGVIRQADGCYTTTVPP